MLLIAAALAEELKTGMAFCRNLQKVNVPRVHLWKAVRHDVEICFLKTGVGPKRSAASLEAALEAIHPAQIMAIGYAGAIDPRLKLGDLVAVAKAFAFSLDKNHPDWEHVRLDDSFELNHGETLASSAKAAGLSAFIGDVLTSPYILGEPAHKRLLYEKFHGSIVDMETAALARVASARSIPLSCIRVVSDEAADSFLAPFSHDPSANIPARARRLFKAGMSHTYSEWKNHASVAKEILKRFLSHYL